MINRCAIILKYNAPAIRWMNEVCPFSDGSEISKDEANRDRTAYLVSDEIGDSSDLVRKWIELNLEYLFEAELSGWCTDPVTWPKICQKLFDEWFEVEYHTVLQDTVDGPIYDDGV